jgi:hypothetical protein
MTAFPEENESDRLRSSWERHAAATLDTYLVAGVEDPRISVQSILTRALLCDALCPGRFSWLIEEELRFGFVMTWLLTHLELGIDKRLMLAAVKRNDRERCPSFVIDAFRMLQVPEGVIPDYVTTALQDRDEPTALSSEATDTFRKIWHQQLGTFSHTGYSLFEPACGSANDYRYLNAYNPGAYTIVAVKEAARVRRNGDSASLD